VFFRTSMMRRAAATVAAGGLLAAGSVLGASAAWADPAQPSHFIQVASSSNIDGDCTYINNGATNDNPDMLLYVTPNFSPGGTGGVSDNGAQVGVYYDTSVSEWCIFNENDSAMQVGQAFNVLAVPPGGADAFQVTATASNSSGDSTFIDSSATNGLPKDVLLATPVYTNAFENHVIGVWYDSGQWGVFNEDGKTMDTSGSAVFNVLVGTSETAGGKNAVQKATSANTGGNSTHINNSATNGDPNSFVLETPIWNPGGKGGKSDTNATGVWYQFSAPNEMVVFNENNKNMALREAFDLLMYNS
jgi:hypothetical protein